MDDATLRNMLKQFGLSDKEIDTYLTLLEHGEAKASTVADAAGVSKRYVYSISEKLEDRGFVSVNDHAVPTTIRANSPEEVTKSLTKNIETMRPALEARYSQAAPQTEQFEVIKSRVTVLKRIRSLIDDADEEVTLSIPAANLDEIADSLRAAVKRGVLVLLVIADADGSLQPELGGVASVARAWVEPMPTMLTVDQRVGVVAPIEMITRTNSDAHAITFTESRLGPVIVGSFLGNYWPMAQQVYVTEPASLPVTYTNFRHTTLQTTLHLQAETPFRAHIRGRWTRDRDGHDEIVGRVVDVQQGLVAPSNNSFPVENTLVIETADGIVTVGGGGAFVEDVEAESVTIEAVESEENAEADG
ncbi:TrmB family transcriptional regulator [Natronococcus sp. JC468]|uniref:TrmB family transcriptional regulator n=1 Tax=Natronococcus sp. JC468 TaxID=1961921 RepID=UPI0014388B9A|nr:TrmB family transcriptional regulator sugar-binding domain-containing protein [Natronococcus sp. JC468]NKE37748.1 TrmB family transcriptional regulator [Natronococcus sp. JC468]